MKLAALVMSLFLSSQTLAQGTNQVQADSAGNPTREFVMSCTYGVLAGTLVGAASLAFEDKPSDNLNHVARGASLGLYAGILLGLYVVYIVPGMESPEEEDPVALAEKLPFILSPRLESGHIAGADLTVHLLRF